MDKINIVSDGQKIFFGETFHRFSIYSYLIVFFLLFCPKNPESHVVEQDVEFSTSLITFAKSALKSTCRNMTERLTCSTQKQKASPRNQNLALTSSNKRKCCFDHDFTTVTPPDSQKRKRISVGRVCLCPRAQRVICGC